MLIVTVGAKGGVGKSTITDLLAVMFAERGPTVQIDAGVTNTDGDTHYRTLLENSPQRARSILDDVASASQWWKHPSWPLQLVRGVHGPHRDRDVVAERLAPTINTAVRDRDHVVVDVGHLDNSVLVRTAIDLADRVVVVINHEPASISSLRNHLDGYIADGLDPAVFSIVYSPRKAGQDRRRDLAAAEVDDYRRHLAGSGPGALHADRRLEWLGEIPFSDDLDELVLDGMIGEAPFPADVEHAARQLVARLLRTDEPPPMLHHAPHHHTPIGEPSLTDRLLDAMPARTASTAPPGVRIAVSVFGPPIVTNGTARLMEGVESEIVSYLVAHGATPRDGLRSQLQMTKRNLRQYLYTLRRGGFIDQLDGIVVLSRDVEVDLIELARINARVVAGDATRPDVDRALVLMAAMRGPVFQPTTRSSFRWCDVTVSDIHLRVEEICVHLCDRLVDQLRDWPTDDQPHPETVFDAIAHVQAANGFGDPWAIGQALATWAAAHPELHDRYQTTTRSWATPPAHIAELFTETVPLRAESEVGEL